MERRFVYLYSLFTFVFLCDDPANASMWQRYFLGMHYVFEIKAL